MARQGWALASGAIAWLVVMFFAANDAQCVKMRDCDAGDLVMFACIGVGCLIPCVVVVFALASRNDR